MSESDEAIFLTQNKFRDSFRASRGLDDIVCSEANNCQFEQLFSCI